jgi:hypothetical protein
MQKEISKQGLRYARSLVHPVKGDPLKLEHRAVLDTERIIRERPDEKRDDVADVRS